MHINGGYLKKLREERKLTVEQAAKHLGLSPCGLINIENGNKGMSIDTLIKLARYYDTSADWIINL